MFLIQSLDKIRELVLINSPVWSVARTIHIVIQHLVTPILDQLSPGGIIGGNLHTFDLKIFN